MLHLSRKKIYLLGVTALFVLVLASRIDFMIGSSFTEGKVVDFESWRSRGKFAGTSFKPIIEFAHGDFIYKFYGEQNDRFEYGDTVRVIFKDDDPSEARVFSFIGFFFTPLLWCILPFIIWTAAIFSFLNKDTVLKIPLLLWKNKAK